MNYSIRHTRNLLLGGLALLFSSGCAAWNEFCGDMGITGGPGQHACGGNWLDNLLPEEAPGTCPDCRPGMSPTPAESDLGMFGWHHGGKAPPPQIATARLHPVPTRPVFSPAPEGEVAATAKKPSVARKSTEKSRTANLERNNRIAAVPKKARRDEPRPTEEASPKKGEPASEEVRPTSGSTQLAEPNSPSTPLTLNGPNTVELRQPEPFETHGEGTWRAVVPGGSTGWLR